MYDLVIGMGEIGMAVYDLVNKKYETECYDIKEDNTLFHNKYRILHICIPYTPEFVETVKEYISRYNPKCVFVWSTVAIGTCGQLGKNVIHTPVEGVHPHLLMSIKRMCRWIGANDATTGYFAEDFFHSLGLITRLVPDTRYTEFLKLYSTSKYGVNIAWADYAKKVADDLGMPFHLTKDFDEDYNDLYRQLDMSKYQRYILEAPEGKIGGHCIRPNAEILSKMYPDEMLTRILEVGENHGN